jgi:hypothetical protein
LLLKDDEYYLTEDSEYEPEGVVKLVNTKILYELVENKVGALKYLKA